MGLQQTSPSGAESTVGLDVMPIDGVTLSDGHCPGRTRADPPFWRSFQPLGVADLSVRIRLICVRIPPGQREAGARQASGQGWLWTVPETSGAVQLTAFGYGAV